jgi:hypothetical protein
MTEPASVFVETVVSRPEWLSLLTNQYHTFFSIVGIVSRHSVVFR